MFSPTQLRSIHAFSRFGTVTEAAAQLGFTPAAVSQQLTQLEKAAHTPLFERVGRTLRLTNAGWVLVRTWERMAAVQEEANAELEATAEGSAGLVRLVSFPTAVRGIVVPLMMRMRASSPGLAIELSERVPEQGLTALLAGEADFAIFHDWEDDHIEIPEGVTARQFAADIADVVLPAGHALAGRRAIDLRDLDGETWVHENNSICSKWLGKSLRQEGIAGEMPYTVAEYESQLAMVSAGMAIALVPRLGRVPLPEGVVPVELRGTRPVRRLFAAWRKSSTRLPQMLALNAALTEITRAD